MLELQDRNISTIKYKLSFFLFFMACIKLGIKCGRSGRRLLKCPGFWSYPENLRYKSGIFCRAFGLCVIVKCLSGWLSHEAQLRSIIFIY